MKKYFTHTEIVKENSINNYYYNNLLIGKKYLVKLFIVKLELKKIK